MANLLEKYDENDTHTHTRSMEDDEKNALHCTTWRQLSIVFTRK